MLVYLLYIDNDEDKSFFEELFYKYRKQMVYYAFGFVSGEVDAEDIVHDVFLKVAQRHLGLLKKLENETDVRNYLLKATKNTALNLAKARSRETELQDERIEHISDEDFTKRICAKLEYNRIVEAINSLDEIYKTVLYYHFVLGLSVKETSSLLDRSISATKKQLVRGKKLLLERLEKEEKL